MTQPDRAYGFLSERASLDPFAATPSTVAAVREKQSQNKYDMMRKCGLAVMNPTVGKSPL